MKISRSWSVVIIVTIIAALLAGAIGTWFSTVFTLIGIYLGLSVIAEIWNQTASKETQMRAGQIKDKLLGIETLGMYNLKGRPMSVVDQVWASLPDNQLSDAKEKDLVFAKQINAVMPDTNALPDSMLFLVARKALYEIQRKRGNLKFHKLGQKPFATAEEIMRPLGNDEVRMFNDFCETDTRSDIKLTTRSWDGIKPWLFGVLAVGCVVGVPLFLTDPYVHFLLLRDWDTFLVFKDHHPAVVVGIVGVILLLFGRDILCWCIKTGGIDSKLEAARASAESEMGKLRAKNQEILDVLDKMSRELARAKANGEASPNSGADRLIIP